jgi:hypothetical protein
MFLLSWWFNRPTLQAYSGSAPSNEEVQRRRDLRNRILRAKGVYLPDPNVKNVASPSVPRFACQYIHSGAHLAITLVCFVQ